eukprot:6893600-Pyramimonas_sp.AAC.1
MAPARLLHGHRATDLLERELIPRIIQDCTKLVQKGSGQQRRQVLLSNYELDHAGLAAHRHWNHHHP